MLPGQFLPLVLVFLDLCLDLLEQFPGILDSLPQILDLFFLLLDLFGCTAFVLFQFLQFFLELLHLVLDTGHILQHEIILLLQAGADKMHFFRNFLLLSLKLVLLIQNCLFLFDLSRQLSLQFLGCIQLHIDRLLIVHNICDLPVQILGLFLDVLHQIP